MKTKTNFYAIFAFSLFVLLAILVQNGMSKGFDQSVYTLIIQMKSDTMTFIMQNISHLASGGAVVFWFVVLLVYRYKASLVFIVYMGLNASIGQLAKHIFMRPRPTILRLIEIGGYSFPSGHSLCAMAMYGLFIYYLAKCNNKKVYHYGIMLVFGLIILLVGISRIYLGVHYASDVMGGYLLSLSFLFCFQSIVAKKNTKLFCA